MDFLSWKFGRSQWNRVKSNKTTREDRDAYLQSFLEALQSRQITWDAPTIAPDLRQHFVAARAQQMFHHESGDMLTASLNAVPECRAAVLFKYAEATVTWVRPWQVVESSVPFAAELRQTIVEGVVAGKIPWRWIREDSIRQWLEDELIERLGSGTLPGADSIPYPTREAMVQAIYQRLVSGSIIWDRDLANLRGAYQRPLLKRIAAAALKTGRAPFDWEASKALSELVPYEIATEIRHTWPRRLANRAAELEPALHAAVVPILVSHARNGRMGDFAFRALKLQRPSLSESMISALARDILLGDGKWKELAFSGFEIRRAVATTVAASSHPHRRALLRQALADGYGRIVEVAANALLADGDREAILPLFERLTHRVDQASARTLVQCLMKFGDVSSLLMTLVENAHTDFVRLSAVEALVELREECLLGILETRLEKEVSKRVKVVLINAAGELGGKDQARLLMLRITQKQPTVLKRRTRHALRTIAGHSPQFVAEAARECLVGTSRSVSSRERKARQRFIPVLNIAQDLARMVIQPVLGSLRSSGVYDAPTNLGELLRELPESMGLPPVDTRKWEEAILAPLIGNSSIGVSALSALVRNSPLESNMLGALSIGRVVRALGSEITQFLVYIWGLSQLQLIPQWLSEDSPPDDWNLVIAT